MNPTRGRGLKVLVTAILLLGLVLPVLLGLWQTLLPAFGMLPAIGKTEPGLQPWLLLLQEPGFLSSFRLSIVTGLVSTALSLLLAIGLCGFIHSHSGLRAPLRLVAPLLAVPHAAMAIGVAFLFSPSGWLLRLLSPWLTGWTTPPNLTTIQDSWGISIILGLLIKELPFLLFVMLAALHQIPVQVQLSAARSLGYGRAAAWLKVIVPQLYPLIRMPVYVVLAFSLSAVDTAIILGPGNPPTLPVQVMRWFGSPDVEKLLPAAAAAILQALLVAGGIGLWIVAEKLFANAGRSWIRRGGRRSGVEAILQLAAAAAALCVATGLSAVLALAVWSVAGNWPFPDAIPAALTTANWMRSTDSWLPATINTVVIASLSGFVSLALAIAWLESEDRTGVQSSAVLMLGVYLPLLVPQVAFLFGLHVFLLSLDVNGTFAVLAWGHALFVFPYVMMALADPWRALDRRYSRIALSLGSSPTAVLFRVKLPMLLRPALAALAIGIAVSVAQYLPTIVLGEGRIVTLTTEAVGLSSGADRRVVAVHAVLQSFVPLAGFAAAVLLPSLLLVRSRTGGRQAS